MRKIGLAILLGLAAVAVQGESVPVSLVSLSVRLETATAEEPLTGLPWESSISSSGDASAPNGELVLADEDVPFTHQGTFILKDPQSGFPIPLDFVLDVPDFVDENENGVADFFERALGTDNKETTGVRATEDGKGEEFTARWNRLPGRTEGQVAIEFPSLGLTFTHDYSIQTYKGEFTYVRTNGGFTGTVLLTNVLRTNEVLNGPWSVTITNENRLGYGEQTWTGAEGASWSLVPLDALDRTGTNYVSLAGFNDGYPATSEADYQAWFLVIHSADQNENGVLDLLESPEPMGEARLAIARSENGLVITVQGESGKSYVLEAAAALGNPQWTAVETVQLSGGTATVNVPLEGGAKFFRLRQ